MSNLLEILKAKTQIQNWDDIRSVVFRPSKGIYQVRPHDDWQYQISASTGEILDSSPRRTSFLVKLHEGSYWGNGIRYGLFFPAAIILTFLWASGLYMGVKFYRKRWKRLKHPIN